MAKIAAEVRRTAVARLEELRADGVLTARHVRTVAQSAGGSERTVWRWLSPPASIPIRQPRPRYTLGEADREAFAFYRGNIAALHRARQAVLAGRACGPGLGARVPRGGVGGRPSGDAADVAAGVRPGADPAEQAAWRTGESGRRAAAVYLRRPDALRGRCWEMDHKQLPLVVLPPKGKAICPWMTTVVDDGTRALLGWAVAVTPTSGTVFTAMRMAMLHEADLSQCGAVPERVRIDQGLEFAADDVEAALGTLAVVMHRLPPFQPHRKGKVERLNLTIDQMLISQLPGFTGGPRDAGGKLYGRGGQQVQIRYMPHDDRQIEVYASVEHLCTAYPTGQLTPEQTEAFRAHARAEAERLGRERRRASPGPARARPDDRRRHCGRGVPAGRRHRRPRPHPARPRPGARSQSRHQPARTHRPHRRPGELMPRHFVDLDGAAALPTGHFQMTTRIVRDIVAGAATGVVHGPAGTGKTFAVEAALEALDTLPPVQRPQVCVLAFPSRPTVRMVADELLRELTGTEIPSSRNRFDLTAKLTG
ncbi:Mu transposase C-terminal domain-containing protein [Streptomyces sp. NPDC092307]|uniref:Mu transposase C-terminal domain-containing protein n=1 Tax=Streptomyces sp. NPDC092307 TaxID=3366013 RepID=UPI003811B3BF